MLAWNAEDAGKIIETYKIYEKKPPDMIMEKSETGVQQKVSLLSIILYRSTDFTNSIRRIFEKVALFY